MLHGRNKEDVNYPCGLTIYSDKSIYFTWGVSKETASMQCLRQMFLASSQSTSKLRVGACSQLKKYECSTPRASRYVEWRTPVQQSKRL